MTTMTRSDIHRPSAPEFDPEGYDCFGVFDLATGAADYVGPGPASTVSPLVDQGWSFRGAPHGSGQCSHCGTHIRYAALMGHAATKTLMYVGETCLDNRFALTQGEFQSLREQTAAKREQSRLLGKAHEFLAANPSMVYLSYAGNIGNAGGVQEWTLGWGGETTYATEAEAQAAFAALPAWQQEEGRGYAPMWGFKRGTTWDEKTRTGDHISTLTDMWHKITRYGDMSEKAVAYAERILGWLDEADQKMVQREAAKDAQVEAGGVVSTGRVVIEGEVTKTDVKYNDYGSRVVMTVALDNGAKVWGTMPSSIDVEKGARVRFTATVEAKDDDPTFGFFKRPAKAEVL